MRKKLREKVNNKDKGKKEKIETKPTLYREHIGKGEGDGAGRRRTLTLNDLFNNLRIP